MYNNQIKINVEISKKKNYFTKGKIILLKSWRKLSIVIKNKIQGIIIKTFWMHAAAN